MPAREQTWPRLIQGTFRQGSCSAEVSFHEALEGKSQTMRERRLSRFSPLFVCTQLDRIDHLCTSCSGWANLCRSRDAAVVVYSVNGELFWDAVLFSSRCGLQTQNDQAGFQIMPEDGHPRRVLGIFFVAGATCDGLVLSR